MCNVGVGERTLCCTLHKGFGRQLLLTSQVECSLIAVPECLVEADADVHGGRGPLYGICLVADIW